MKKLAILLFSIPLFSGISNAQPINAAWVHQQYAKYPTRKSGFCPSCRVWNNPYYVSIADTLKHTPLWEYAVYTRADRLQQQAAKIPRKGVYAEWFTVTGDIKLDAAYSEANAEINKPKSIYEIVYGHCGLAWILAARDALGAIFSDTETYGEGAEYQGQNIGTEIWTENRCRMLTGWGGDNPKTKQPIEIAPVTQSIQIWAGTVCGPNARTYTKNGVTIYVADYYWKILVYNGITECYWMPNLPSENQAAIVHCKVSHDVLVANLHFDPLQVDPRKYAL